MVKEKSNGVTSEVGLLSQRSVRSKCSDIDPKPLRT
jgi:hypothetical protein